MTHTQTLLCPPFRFDLAERRVWQASQELFLRPKAFAVLHYLLERPGQFVTKRELLEAVWPRTYVNDGVVKVCIRELRKVLGDDVRTPRYIETVYRRGYRFIAPVQVETTDGRPQAPPLSPQVSRPQPPAVGFVGRQPELETLRSLLDKALSGTRQTVFVTGEPGIGKTTLLDTFLTLLRTAGDVWIAQGQCVEQYGAGEAYLPLLTALGRLCREPNAKHLVALLRQRAPTWIVQLPWLLTDAELARLQHRLQRSTPERMLREFAEAAEVFTAERPLVLWLDDLQWSDDSTLALLSFLAQQQEQARLLVVGAYRPSDALANRRSVSAVAHELHLRGRGVLLPLGLLSEADVRHYLAQREVTAGHSAALLSSLTRFVYRRTEGNPLFMVNVVEDVLSQGRVERADGAGAFEEQLEKNRPDVPDSLRQMIEQRLDRLDVESRRLLEVASIAGPEFSAAAIAIGGQEDGLQTENRCAELARRQQFVRAKGSGEWPDGTVTTRYEFLHALYQEVLYERLPAGTRRSLHEQIAKRQERGYGRRAPEIAAELAVHFEQGRDYDRAIQYRQHAAHVAVQRYAYREAIAHLNHAVELLQQLPARPDRKHTELHLLLQLTEPMMILKGEAAPQVERTYARALELSQQLDEPAVRCRVLLGLGTVHLVRGDILTAHRYGQQAMALTKQARQPLFPVFAHQALGLSSLYQGHLVPALGHLENALTLAEAQPSAPSAAATKSVALAYTGVVLWTLGYPEQALRRSQEALAVCRAARASV